MARRRKLGKRKRGRARGKRRLFRRKRVGKRGRTKYGVGKGIMMLGSTSAFPRRQVVKCSITSDWQAIGSLGAGIVAAYNIGMNTTFQPTFSFTGYALGYRGLGTLLHSTQNQATSQYKSYKILWNKCTVQFCCLNSVITAQGLQIALYPQQVGSAGAGNMILADNKQYVKKAIIGPTSGNIVTVKQSVNVRKFFGLTTAEYGNPAYTGNAGGDPANVAYWRLLYTGVPNAGVLPANLYASRLRLDCLVELTNPWDSDPSDPS